MHPVLSRQCRLSDGWPEPVPHCIDRLGRMHVMPLNVNASHPVVMLISTSFAADRHAPAVRAGTSSPFVQQSAVIVSLVETPSYAPSPVTRALRRSTQSGSGAIWDGSAAALIGEDPRRSCPAGINRQMHLNRVHFESVGFSLGWGFRCSDMMALIGTRLFQISVTS